MKGLDFNVVLAIGIHDMKNSLNRMLVSVDALAGDGEDKNGTDPLGQLQYEARRMKDNLTKLLTIYRHEHGLYQPAFASTNLYDLLEDCWLNNKPLLDQRGLNCTIDCDPQLCWTVDRYLVMSLVENVLTNTFRYTRASVRLGAWAQADGLFLVFDDDGPGFPEAMLGRRALIDSVAPDVKLGNTGLGLHFCAMVVDIHVASDGCRGFVELSNGSPLGGGRFSVWLPPLD